MKAGIRQVQPSNVQTYENLSTKFQRLVHSTAKEDGLESEPNHIAFWYVIHHFLDKMTFL